MNTLTKTVFAKLFAVIGSAGMAQNFKANHNKDDSKIALLGYSPVSYLDLGIAQKGVKEYKATFDGLNYYFTTKE